MNLTIEQAIEKLKTPGTKFSGADWKFGWPHKFIIGDDRVYNTQLRQASPELIERWNEVTTLFFGIHFFLKDGQPVFSCRYQGGFAGYQRAGTVSERGQPIRSDVWNHDYGTN